MDIRNTLGTTENQTNTTSPPVHNEKALPQYVIIVFNVVAGLVVVTNIAHLWIIRKQRRMKSRVEDNNYMLFVIILGVFDFSLGVTRLMFSNNLFQSLLIQYIWFCTVTGIYVNVVYGTMAAMILMVCIDRTYSLHHSVTAYKSVSFVRYYPQISSCVTALFCILYSTLGVIFKGAGYSTKDLGNCNLGSDEYPMLAAIPGSFFLPTMLAITLLYSYAMCLMRGHVKRTNHRKSRAIKATRTVGCIILASWLCWTPPIFSSVLWGFGIPSVPLEITPLLTLEFNSIANPLIYGLSHVAYRTAAVDILQAINLKRRD